MSDLRKAAEKLALHVIQLNGMSGTYAAILADDVVKILGQPCQLPVNKDKLLDILAETWETSAKGTRTLAALYTDISVRNEKWLGDVADKILTMMQTDQIEVEAAEQEAAGIEYRYEPHSQMLIRRRGPDDNWEVHRGGQWEPSDWTISHGKVSCLEALRLAAQGEAAESRAVVMQLKAENDALRTTVDGFRNWKLAHCGNCHQDIPRSECTTHWKTCSNHQARALIETLRSQLPTAEDREYLAACEWALEKRHKCVKTAAGWQVFHRGDMPICRPQETMRLAVLAAWGSKAKEPEKPTEQQFAVDEPSTIGKTIVNSLRELTDELAEESERELRSARAITYAAKKAAVDSQAKQPRTTGDLADCVCQAIRDAADKFLRELESKKPN
ncbi:hypothetical protein M0R72_12725 [Candidatus Pacearchaeota archaeon]|jgi:hypothetical protein|nr:hypothetical protein [Candidatus Pacearchaeota archaeon]